MNELICQLLNIDIYVELDSVASINQPKKWPLQRRDLR